MRTVAKKLNWKEQEQIALRRTVRERDKEIEQLKLDLMKIKIRYNNHLIHCDSTTEVI